MYFDDAFLRKIPLRKMHSVYYVTITIFEIKGIKKGGNFKYLTFHSILMQLFLKISHLNGLVKAFKKNILYIIGQVYRIHPIYAVFSLN